VAARDSVAAAPGPLYSYVIFEKGAMRSDLLNTRSAARDGGVRRRLGGAGLCGLALVLLLCAIFGCGGLPEYGGGGGANVPAKITPRTMWRVVGSGGIEGAARALDDDRDTAAVSGASYEKAYVTIDLGKVCLFNMVAIDHGPSEYGFCERVAVLTSLDGGAYTPRQSEPGTRRVSIVSLIRPVLARYVRIRADAESGRPWSIAEVYLQ